MPALAPRLPLPQSASAIRPIVPRFLDGASTPPKIEPATIILVVCVGIVPVIIVGIAVVWLLTCYSRDISCLACCCPCIARKRKKPPENPEAEDASSNSSDISLVHTSAPWEDRRRALPTVPLPVRPHMPQKRGDYARSKSARRERLSKVMEEIEMEDRRNGRRSARRAG
ncbi:hypothetical protein P154DRAFT_272616 [Amniculicola lignicola CBS 123094]|uniref:Uncharacterized protein n=1 Tax=Amniculicola lignicola CBS 123094 TaxID=1392246 RepID=A0A6A5W7B8_9PLEO|nr:hypothetical protein P154DRAFT_272616 [Amniculicola lignicola CBS 123094]